MLYEQQMPRCVLLPHLYFSSDRIAFFYTLIRFRVCTANEQQQWEVLDRSKVNNFATRPLYLCRISVSDSSLVKIYQRIDRPPSLLFDVSSLLYFIILCLVGFCWQRIANGLQHHITVACALSCNRIPHLQCSTLTQYIF